MSTTFTRGENPLRADKLNSAFNERVSRGGDTMQGPLYLRSDPQQTFEAATKNYVDMRITASIVGSGVLSFNGRSGYVVQISKDVTDALGYTPYNATNPSGYITASTLAPYALTTSVPVASSTLPTMNAASAAVGIGVTWARADHTHPSDTSRYAASNPSGYQTAAQVSVSISAASYVLPIATTSLLGGVKIDGTSITISNGVISSAAAQAAGVASFNTRTGAVVLNSGDVTTALTFTPYNATNPSGYITSASVPVASSTTPSMDGSATVGVGTTWARADHVHPVDTSRYAATNPSGYQTAAQVTAAVPVAATVTPLAGTTAGAVGVGAKWAREDHVHPIGVSVVVADVAPTIANGLLWFDGVGASLYIGYNDGNSTQWVLIGRA